MPEPVFEIFEEKQGKYRFRLRAANKEIIAASQGYSSKQGCRKGIDSVKENAQKADVVENEEGEVKIFEMGHPAMDSVTAGLIILSAAIAIFALVLLAL